MNKPVIVLKKEFEDELMHMIERYSHNGLPAFVMNQIVKGIEEDLGKAEEYEYKAALKVFKEMSEKECQESTE